MRRYASLSLSVAVFGWGVVAHSETLVEAEVRKICTPAFEEDAGAPDMGFHNLQALGEPGRQALVALAKQNDTLGACGFDYLYRLGDVRAVPVAREVLKDPGAVEDRLSIALSTVEEFEDTQSFDRVLELFRVGSKRIKGDAAHALGALGDPRGLAALRDALTDPAYADALLEIIEAVGVEGHEQAIDALVAIGQAKDPKSMALSECISSLAGIGSPRSRAAAMSLLDRFAMKSSRLDLIVKLFGSFWGQRCRRTDAGEKAEIKGSLSG
jgi:HEAT repeat protein